ETAPTPTGLRAPKQTPRPGGRPPESLPTSRTSPRSSPAGRRLVDEPEREAQSPDGCEERERVALHASRLDVTEQTTRLAGRLRQAVDGAVDHLLVDDVIGLAGRHGRP